MNSVRDIRVGDVHLQLMINTATTSTHDRVSNELEFKSLIEEAISAFARDLSHRVLQYEKVCQQKTTTSSPSRPS